MPARAATERGTAGLPRAKTCAASPSTNRCPVGQVNARASAQHGLLQRAEQQYTL